MAAYADNKFDKFLKHELAGSLKDVIIIAEKDGTYILFGKYRITPIDGSFEVTIFHTDTVHEFMNIKNAVAWCTFYNVKKYHEARRIKELDLKLSSMEIDISIQQRMANKNANDPNMKWVYIVKYQEALRKKKVMLNELLSYINTSKMIQDQLFSKTKGSGFKHNR